MNAIERFSIFLHVLRWRLTWNKYDLHFPSPVKDNPKFMNAWDAVKLIPDDAIIGISGIGANQRPALLYWAIRDRFLKEGHPGNITIIGIGGQGGRGIVPGTVEELAVEGLNTRLITSHTEMFKAQQRLAHEGKLELQCSLLGSITHIFRAQAEEGRNYIINDTGAGTFIDPRAGTGTPVAGTGTEQWVEIVEGDRFKYSLPMINTAVFAAAAADRKGNIYFKNGSVICEGYSIAKAAKRNGGRTLVNVGVMVDEGFDSEFLPAEYVDAIVYWPETEQTATVKQRKYWDFFTVHSKTPVEEGIEKVRQINKILKITPQRYPIDEVLARLATRIFVDNARKGDHVDIGFGLPEETARLLYESGIMNDLYMINESGVFGGVSAPGIFFGAAVNPREIIPTCDTFDRIYSRLDWVILGALQVDSQGNVNVSKRGEGPMNHVGPGGFIDLITAAESILFCSTWGEDAQVEVQGGEIKILERGKPKFIENVDEITFNGAEALKNGKRVLYTTPVGAFRLTERGMELTHVMPGVDIQRDIMDYSPMNIVLPENGHPTLVSSDIVTGKGFHFALRQ
jgi:propionate CoA-transferase